MKSKLLTISLVVCAFSMSANAIDFIDGLTRQFTDGKGPEYICRKASVLDLKFSIRSGGGVACKVPFVAAVAEIICTEKDFDKYSASGCHDNATAALGGKSPKDVLVAESLKLGNKAAQAVCVAASVAVPLLSPACYLIKKGGDWYLKDK